MLCPHDLQVFSILPDSVSDRIQNLKEVVIVRLLVVPIALCLLVPAYAEGPVGAYGGGSSAGTFVPQKINLELKDVCLAEALSKLFLQTAQRQYIADPTVAFDNSPFGQIKVTATLKDASIEDALKTILQPNGLTVRQVAVIAVRESEHQGQKTMTTESRSLLLIEPISRAADKSPSPQPAVLVAEQAEEPSSTEASKQEKPSE
jgi:hypothetical protein